MGPGVVEGNSVYSLQMAQTISSCSLRCNLIIFPSGQKDTGMLLWYCRSRFISPRCFYELPIFWGGLQYLPASIFNGYSFIKIMLRIWILSGYSIILISIHLALIIKFKKIFIFSMEWKLNFEMRFFKKSWIAFIKIQNPRFNNFH